jgi:nitrous oxide reductase accessory protein NosL
VRRQVLVIAIALAAVAGCSLRRSSPPPSPYCRPGNPLAGVYHPSRLHVKSRCRVVSGMVERVKYEAYDGDVHIALRPDPGQEHLLSGGNDQVGGALILEIIPQDRARVLVPDVGTRVSVVGPWVDDTAHDWMEIHPVWYVSSGRVVPASTGELRRVQLLLRGVEGAAAEDDG